MRGRIAKKIYKRLAHREACFAGGCYCWVSRGKWWRDLEKCHKCKYGKDVAWRVDYLSSVKYHTKVRRIAERCYTQYSICLRIWKEVAHKYQTPRPPIEPLVEVAVERYQWDESKALVNMVDFLNEIRFKNRRNKDYRDEPT